MSVIAQFDLPARDFVFGALLGSQPIVRLRLETMVPTGTYSFYHRSYEPTAVIDVPRSPPLRA